MSVTSRVSPSPAGPASSLPHALSMSPAASVTAASRTVVRLNSFMEGSTLSRDVVSGTDDGRTGSAATGGMPRDEQPLSDLDDEEEQDPQRGHDEQRGEQHCRIHGSVRLQDHVAETFITSHKLTDNGTSDGKGGGNLKA